VEPRDKIEILKIRLKAMGRVAVAFSGGLDSSFLLRVAHDVLGGEAIAVTAQSPAFPGRELREALDLAQAIGVKHIIIPSDELDIEGFSDNPPDRCYLCKRNMCSKIRDAAGDIGVRYVADGSTADDTADYRPGMKAVRELGIVCPLQEAGLGKDEIRTAAKAMGLPVWDKPAFACLYSRIPYGQKITREKLLVVDVVEQFLRDLGFRQVRVRHHGEIARIEISPRERSKFFDTALMDAVHDRFRKAGFAYVALDLKGYRTGSMNEVIGK
jgi:uncharacterized protein